MRLDLLPVALRWLREARMVSQVEVARRAGLTKAMVNAYERGRRVPSLPSLAALLGALNVTLCDLHRALKRSE